MPLPQIDNVETIVMPAATEKTFPNLYIQSLQLLPRANTQFIRIILRPYNIATGEMYPYEDKDVAFEVDNVWTEAVRSTLFAQVIGGIVQVTALLIQERELVVQYKAATEENKPAIKAVLDAVRTGLGAALDQPGDVDPIPDPGPGIFPPELPPQ